LSRLGLVSVPLVVQGNSALEIPHFGSANEMEPLAKGVGTLSIEKYGFRAQIPRTNFLEEKCR
jgi:hypothetical protein